MSKIMQEIKSQMTRKRFAAPIDMVSVDIEESPETIARMDIMDEYKITVEIGQTVRCHKGDKNRAFDNVCDSVQELIYGDFHSRLLQIERAWFERDSNAIESGFRDLFKMIGRG